MDEIPEVPGAVKLCAATVGMIPMRWTLTADEIIILFTTGAKIHFPRPGRGGFQPPSAVSAPRGADAQHNHKQMLATEKTTAPALQRLPVKRKARK